jgi:hypothetical protein
MLDNYYDINKYDKFEKLFADLYIGKNPTEERNNFLVWKNSFAGDKVNIKLIDAAGAVVETKEVVLGDAE